jgi:ribosomal protein S18 acetylase RimI-like enzyme
VYLESGGPAVPPSALPLNAGTRETTVNPVLRPITETEFSAWLSHAIPEYAADKIASGAWPEQGALERSRQDHEALLPRGKDTPGHFICSILGDSGGPVGTIWFAAEERGTARVAYVYNVVIQPEHRRRRHALRAFEALDAEAGRMGLAGVALHVFGHNAAAQALYAKLGFKPTNFNLYRPVGGTGA